MIFCCKRLVLITRRTIHIVYSQPNLVFYRSTTLARSGQTGENATDPKITEIIIWVDVNTFNSTGNNVTSYFRSAAIGHFVNLTILNWSHISRMG